MELEKQNATEHNNIAMTTSEQRLWRKQRNMLFFKNKLSAQYSNIDQRTVRGRQVFRALFEIGAEKQRNKA